VYENHVKPALHAARYVYRRVFNTVVEHVVNIYYRKADKSLGQLHVDIEDHEEAILLTKEHLVAEKKGYSGAVLALIEGWNGITTLKEIA
jgi:hypothetical protein